MGAFLFLLQVSRHLIVLTGSKKRNWASRTWVKKSIELKGCFGPWVEQAERERKERREDKGGEK